MYDRQQTKALQRAFNTTTAKDYGKEGLDENNNLKEGFFRTKTGEIVSVEEITGVAPALPYDIEAEAAKHKLRNLKGIGTEKDGTVKKGFYQLEDGAVISLKKLHEAYTENLEVNE